MAIGESEERVFERRARGRSGAIYKATETVCAAAPAGAGETPCEFLDLKAMDYSGFVDGARKCSIVQPVGEIDERARDGRDWDPAVNGSFIRAQRPGAVDDDAYVAVLARSADLDRGAPRADLPESGC
jgi:hypothetical protein